MNYKTKFKTSDFSDETQDFFRNKKVVVTGGSGFIGSHVVEQLLSLEVKQITVPTRQSNPEFLSALKDKVEICKCDLIGDYQKTKEMIKGNDVVLNLTAMVAGIEYNSSHPASIFQQNLEMFFNVIKASQENNVERFLVTSSACVYPRHCTIPTPETEGFKEEPEPTNSGYGWAKRMEEYLGRKYAEEYGLSVAIARPYNAYGPRDNFDPKTSHVIPSLIKKAFDTKEGILNVWGDGSHSRSFLYVDDFAKGLIETAAMYPNADPINIGNYEEITIKELANMIANLVSDITGKQITPKFDESGKTGQPRRMCDTKKAQEKIGYKSKVSFPEGLKETINWYMQHKLKTNN
jgi:GDP-L-fucose synthase